MLPGTYVQAKITTLADSVWALPQSALALENGVTVVYAQKGDSFEPFEVKTGCQDGAYTEVILPPELQAATLVTKGAYYLKRAAGKEE